MFHSVRSFISLGLLACGGCHANEVEAPATPSPVPVSSARETPTPAASAAATAGTDTAPPVAATPAFPAAPAALAVPQNSSLVLKARGKGVQIYECAAKPDAPKDFAWKLKAPEADLFDDKGEKVAHHFAGPTWQAPDGSTVLGSVMAKADAPDAKAIPWLLLTSVGKGPGVFAPVLHVQRLDTNGGKAPEAGCDAAQAKSHTETRVPYEATYYFYSLTPGSK